MSEQDLTPPIPEAWPDLLQLAGDALEVGDKGIDNDKLWTLVRTIQQLGQTALYTNLSYAIRQGTDELASRLHSPETKEAIIEDGKAILVARSEQPYDSISSPGDLSFFSEAFQPTVDETYHALSSKARLVGNFLAATQHQRIIENLTLSKPEHEIEKYIALEDQILDLNHQGPSRLLRLLGQPIKAGTFITLDKILRRYPEYGEACTSPDLAIRKLSQHQSVRRLILRGYEQLRDERMEERLTKHALGHEEYPSASVNDATQPIGSIVIAIINRACDELDARE
jgi:hypothetical protein